MDPLTPAEQNDFEAAIVDAFTLPELARLVRLRFGQRLEVLVSTANPLVQVVFDLMEYVRRMGWTEELVRGVHEERPNNTEVVRFFTNHPRCVLGPTRSTAELAQDIGTGLTTVAARLSQDNGVAIRAVLAGGARVHFQVLGTRFSVLRKYKVLHGCLHNLQFKYARMIADGVGRFRDNPSIAEMLTLLLGEMADELKDAREFVPGLATGTAEIAWLNVADEAVRCLREGIEKSDVTLATRGNQFLEGLLRVQPTRINELLTAALDGLPLDQLLDAFRQLRDQLADDSWARALTSAIAALCNLHPRLLTELSDHQDWQLVDNTLRQIETGLRFGYTVEQAAFEWGEAKRVLFDLMDAAGNTGWAGELRDLATRFEAALTAADPVAVKASFERFKPRAMWYFYRADEELKKLSGELTAVGNQLDLILRVIGNGPN